MSQNNAFVALSDKEHNTLPIHEASSSVIVTV